MKTIQHHPDDELLLSYSAASLPLSQALCVSAHIDQCEVCSRKLSNLEYIGSELMQRLKPSAPSDSLKTQLLAQLDNIKPELDSTRAAGSQADSEVPRCLRQFFDHSYAGLNWKRASSDIKTHELCRGEGGSKVELLRIRPGGSASRHTHMGDEYTVILKGSFSDELGLFCAGDFIVRDSSHTHKPVATKDQECICLALTEGPIQFTGFFGRMLNPLVRRSYGV